MRLDDARRIAAEYGLDAAALQPLEAGSVNSNFRFQTRSGERYFLRVYEEQADQGAAAELTLVTELSALGLPTPAPLARTSTGFVSRHAGKPVGVYPWVEGESRCLAQLKASEVSALGAALARLHSSTSALSSVPAGRFGLEGVRARLDGIERTTDAYADDVGLIRERLRRYSALVNPALPSGLIHGDLFRDNVLFRGGEIAALLDFESASRGSFAYDLMVCVHAWCFVDDYRPELVSALIGGYQSCRPLERLELQALRVEGCLAALRFATTRITDYAMRARDGEPPVRDYRRFLQRMRALEAGALDSIIQEANP